MNGWLKKDMQDLKGNNYSGTIKIA